MVAQRLFLHEKRESRGSYINIILMAKVVLVPGGSAPLEELVEHFRWSLVGRKG